MDRDQVRVLISGASSEHRAQAAALLLVRYCSLADVPYFDPWFADLRDGLRSVVGFAEGVVREGVRVGQAQRAVAGIDELLDSADPDGTPFEIKVAGALRFAAEVCEALNALESVDKLSKLYERAGQLARAQEAVARFGVEARDDWSPPVLREAEAVAAVADLTEDVGDQALQRSRRFAQDYADVTTRLYAKDNPVKRWVTPDDF